MTDYVRLIPLGGIGNVTKNMYVYEYGDEILLVDCGIGFPESSMLGVDLLIPDITYLKDKVDRIVGMVITHGHDDHIAGLPYILPQLEARFPIFASGLTLGFIKDRLKDFDLTPNLQPMPENEFSLGSFQVLPIRMTHSVPDTRHLAISTPVGTFYHGSDFKFDLNPVDGVRPDFQRIASVGAKGVVALLSDCLNSESQQFSSSESSLEDMFAREMRGVPGKILVTVMSSNIHRVQQAVNVAQAYNRKVAFVGRSVERNVQTAVNLGYLKLPKDVVSKREINKVPAKQMCVIIAGSQGQEGSSLTRAAGGEHDLVQILPQDKVIFASEPIPGNEHNVYAAIDSISHTGADVTYSDIDPSVHVSGHSSAIEQKLLIALTTPKHVIPVGGTFHHMTQYRKLARSMNYKDKNIHLLENGQVLAFDRNGGAYIDEVIELKNIMVDGLGVGDVGTVVLRDRQRMSEDGIVTIIVPVEQQTGLVRGEIEVISRGFVYVKESQEIIEDIKRATSDSLADDHGYVSDWQSIRRKIEKNVERLLYDATQRRPLVLPVVIEV